MSHKSPLWNLILIISKSQKSILMYEEDKRVEYSDSIFGKSRDWGFSRFLFFSEISILIIPKSEEEKMIEYSESIFGESWDWGFSRFLSFSEISILIIPKSQ